MTMDYSEETHLQRLNLICRICGEKTTTKKSKPVKCDKYVQPIKTHYNIDLLTDRKSAHSTLMCYSCRQRLMRCMQGQPLNHDLKKDIDTVSVIWSDFDANKQISEQ